jgi:two-component system KDP operon response regulator KdpE
MNDHRSVLIVDRSSETREVLKTALERRGMRIFTSGRAREGLRLAGRHRPDLIVLDMDVEDLGPQSAVCGFAAHTGGRPGALVVLGSAEGAARRAGTGEFVSKPYHYAPLLRKIEELLCHHQRPRLARGA